MRADFSRDLLIFLLRSKPLIDLVNEIFKKEDRNLIEAVAESICSTLLDSYPVDKVKLKIRKPHAPINANLDTVQVSIIRSK